MPTDGLSRRKLLRTGAGAGAAALLGGAALGGGSALLTPGSPASAHGTLYTYNEIWGQPTYYQDLGNGNATPASFQYQQNLYVKLEEWLYFHYMNTPATYRTPGAVYLNGTHVDKPGMHQYGRAADISTVMMFHSYHNFTFDAFNARYNVWGSGPQAYEYRRRYWATVCSMNIFFKYVLHYAYNSDHHNHVHVDNEASDGTFSTFSTGSRSQVLAVQAACAYVFGYGTSIDGDYGPQTINHSGIVLALTGKGGHITDSQAHWHHFLWACMRAGHDLSIGSSSLTAATTKPIPGKGGGLS